MAKESPFTTVYDPDAAGTLSFSRREDLESEILSYLELVGQVKKDYKDEPQVLQGLHEIEMQLNALRISGEDPEQVRQKLDSLVRVPIGPDRSLRLDAFRRHSSKGQVADEAEYREYVRRLVRNTTGNVTQLMLTWPDDTILQRFMEELEALQLDGPYRDLRERLGAISKSPQLWHYNERKKEFLVEWLRPYQAYFGKPVDELSDEELQAALKQVEQLREQRLEDMTNLEVVTDRSPFRVYNRRMHPIVNGKNKEFWGSAEVRDEFIALMNKLITRFSFNLEDRFLLFRTKDGEFCYLVGFADDAFEEMRQTKEGRLALYPHIKVFLRTANGQFHELIQEDYHGDGPAYFRALKTAVVPFLTSMSVMVEVELSDALKQAFDMWI